MKRLLPPLTLAMWSALSACGGQIGSDAGGPAGSGGGAGSTPLRRLTRTQYANTLRDLLGVADASDYGLPPDDRVGPFSGNPRLAVSNAHVRAYAANAEKLAEAAVQGEILARILPCPPSEGAACVETFIRTFGQRAFRRPLDEATVVELKEIHAAGTDFTDGIRLVVGALLQAPEFLYHFESAPRQPREALDAYELASRLSYFLWQTLPDPELIALAESGALATAEGVRAQAERMLNDPRARTGVARFAQEWLHLEGIESIARDPDLFPQFNAAMATAMLDETVEFVDHVLRRDDGRLETLLTAPYSFPGAPLSGIYGLDATAAGAQGAKVALPPERSGVLTHPSVLAATSHSDQTSLVKRGVFLLQNVLCYEITFPVGLEIPSLPDPDPTKTTRERFAEHEASPVCGTCHKVIDPLGFVFERYDPVGALRDTENGKPVDDTGTVEVGDPVADGFTRGAVELTRKLATSPMVRSCMVKQWHRFALGRAEGKADEGTLAALESEFADSGYNLRALVLGLVTQDSFRLKSPEAR